MIVLVNTTDHLEIVLGGGVATSELPFTCDYVDHVLGTSYTPGRTVGNSNGTSAVDLAPAPAASTYRQIKLLTIYNADTAGVVVTVRYNANGTSYVRWKGTLSVGDTLQYVDADGFSVIDNTGARKGVGTSGATGASGRNAGVKYSYSTNTALSDPGSGTLKLDDTTLSSATSLRISETDGDGNGLVAWLNSWDDSDSTVRGTLFIRKDSDPAVFTIFSVTGALTDNGGWDTIPVTHVVTSGSFTNADTVKLHFFRTGDKGATGATGSTGSTGATGASGTDGRPGREGQRGYDGATWYTGEGDPKPSLGQERDHYLRTDNGTVWTKTSPFFGVHPGWKQTGILKGLKGDRGEPGPRGERGERGQPGAPSPVANWFRCDGRVTTESGVWESTSDRTSQGTVYFTTMGRGNILTLRDDNGWRDGTFSELSLALSLSSGSNYDLFLWISGGSAKLSLGPAWSGANSRGTGAGTTELEMFEGVLVNKVAITGGPAARRGIYAGSVRGSGANVTEDSLTKRFVYSWFNRLGRRLYTNPGYNDNNAYTSYTTTSTSFEEVNAGTASKVEFLLGQAGKVYIGMSNVTTASSDVEMGIAINSATSASKGTAAGTPQTDGATDASTELGIGYHYADLLMAVSAGIASIYADMPRFGSSADPRMTALFGEVMA